MMYPWLESTWMALKTHYRQGYLPHALVLAGARGLGKQYLAKKLAQLIFCELNADNPCGNCRQCHLFEALSHPDYLSVVPEEANQTIKIEQVRSLIDTLNQTPLVAKAQVVVIDPLESMTLKAANALLKTLEEPLGNVFFILIAHRLTHIPVTLLSRCQLYSISVAHNEQALQWVVKELACTEAEAQVLLRLSHDAPLEALALSQRKVILLRNRLLQIMNNEITESHLLASIEALVKEYSDDVFSILKLILQDICKCQLGVAIAKWANVDAVRQIQQLAARITRDHLQEQLDALMRIEKALSTGIAINLQMALESMLVSSRSCDD